MYHAVDICGDIECNFDISQRQQHRAFNRHLDGQSIKATKYMVTQCMLVGSY